MNHCSSSCLSSVSLCDDLVAEILLRVPLISVFKFKCVSKTWNHLISDPIFCANYQSRRKNSLLPLLGFYRVTLAEDRSAPKLSFLPNCKEMKYRKSDCIENYFISHGSPEGLILCRLQRFQDFTYYVCDPFRNQWFPLPQPNKGNYVFIEDCFSVSFSCEGCSKDDMVHFKVIRAMKQRASYDILPIETFSSRTGKWSESFLTSPSEFSLGQPYEAGESVDGIFYWKVRGHFAAYDPNMGENRLWLIKLPPRCEREGHTNYILGRSADGCLRFALNDKLIFRVWDLKKKLSSYSLFHIIPSSEWMLKEVVSYKKLDIINYSPTGHTPHIRHLNKYPILMAFQPRNSKLVYLRRGSRMFWYDFETRRLEPIRCHGTPPLTCDRVVPYFQPPSCHSLPFLHYLH